MAAGIPGSNLEAEGYEGRPVESTSEIVSEERKEALGEPDDDLFPWVGQPLQARATGGAPQPQPQPQPQGQTVFPYAAQQPMEPPPAQAPPEYAEPSWTEEVPPEGEPDDEMFSWVGQPWQQRAAQRAPGAGPFRVPMPGTPQAFPYAPQATAAAAADLRALESIPGLELAAARIAALPKNLAPELPAEFRINKGRLTDEELERLWYQTAMAYNTYPEVEDRAAALGNFMIAWKPEVGKRLGFGPQGHIEPTGFWKFLDGFDKYVDRPLRSIVNTIWDMQLGEAASIASGGKVKKPGLDDAWRMLKRNFTDDRGTIEDGETVLRSLFLSAGALFEADDYDNAVRMLTAEERYDEGEQAAAEWLTGAGWTVAAPFIKLTTGASDEAIERSRMDALEEGGAGGHFALGLGGLMAVSPLNFASYGAGGAAKGAGTAALKLLQGGVKLTPRGKVIADGFGLAVASRGRRSIVSKLESKYGVEEISSLSRINRRLDRVETVIEGRSHRAVDTLEDVASGADELGAAALADDAAFQVGRVDELTAMREDLITQFDEAHDALRGPDSKVSARDVRENLEFHAAAVSAADFNQAVNVAFRHEAPLRGGFAVQQLSELRLGAIDAGMDLRKVDEAWAKGLRAADEADEILVKLIVDSDGAAFTGSRAITKSPEVAFIYERALAGDYGIGARIAALRPEYSALEKLLKKGVKGVPDFDTLKTVARERLIKAHRSGKTRKGRAAKYVAERIGAGVRGRKGVEALKLKTKRALLHGEDLASNINPLSFALAHGIAKRMPWIDTARRALSGLWYVGTRHPATYTRLDPVSGRRVAIPRKNLDHPALLYKGTKADRQRLRTRNILQARWPAIEAQIVKITDDPEMLELARNYVEMGWADEVTGVKGLQELVAVAAVRKINSVIDEIAGNVEIAATKGGEVQHLSPESTRQAINALEELKTLEIEGRVHEGFDAELIDSLIAEIAEYSARTAELAPLREAAEAFGPSALAFKDRQLKLALLKKRMQLFALTYETSVKSVIRGNAEGRIVQFAQEHADQIKHYQEKLIEIEDKLKAKKADGLTTKEYMDFVDDALRQAEELVPDFTKDEVIPLSVKDVARAAWVQKAAVLTDRELATHIAGIRDELVKEYGSEADADIIMGMFTSFAETAVKQGVIKRPEEWFHQLDVKSNADFPRILAEGMLFNESKVAPVFYSRLRRAIESSELGVTHAKAFRAEALATTLRDAGVSEKVVRSLGLEATPAFSGAEIGAIEAAAKSRGLRVRKQPPQSNQPGSYRIYTDDTVKSDLRKAREGEWAPSAAVTKAEEVVEELRAAGVDASIDRLHPSHSGLRRGRVYMGDRSRPGELVITATPKESWLQGKLAEAREKFTGPEKYAPTMDTLKVMRADLEDWISTGGHDPEAILGALDTVPSEFRVDQLEKLLRSSFGEEAVRDTELVATGFGRWLERLKAEGTTKVTRDELIDFIDRHGVELQDDVRGYYHQVTEKRAAPVHRMGMEEAQLFSEEFRGNLVRGVEEAVDGPVAEVSPVRADDWNPEGNLLEVEYFETPGDLVPVIAQFSPEELGLSRSMIERSVAAEDIAQRGLAEQAGLRPSETGLHLDRTEAKWARDDDYFFLVSPGASKNSELLLINPKSGAHSESSMMHWPDIYGVEGHIRFNIRTDSKGRRVLYIEEAQSDVAQALSTARKLEKKLGSKDRAKLTDEESRTLGSARADRETAAGTAYEDGWVDLVLKRALAFAVNDTDEAIDAIAWTTGKTQISRYRSASIKVKGKGLTQQYDKEMPAVAARLFNRRGAKSDGFEFDVTESFADAERRITERYGPDRTETIEHPVTKKKITVRLRDESLEKLNNTAPLRKGKRTLTAHGFEITPELRASVKEQGVAFFQTQKDTKRGMTKLLDEDRVLVAAFKNSTKATVIHEVGHVLRRNLSKPDQVKAKNWLTGEAKRLRSLSAGELPPDLMHLFPEGKVGRVVTDEGKYTELGEELFARGWEKYLATRKAPPGMKGVFDRLKEWLKVAYDHMLHRSDVQLDDEITALFDKYLLAKEPKPMAKRPLWKTKLSDVAPKEGQTLEAAREMHRASVQAALEAGEKVPQSVLIGYPADFIGYITPKLEAPLRRIEKARIKYESALQTMREFEGKLAAATGDLDRSVFAKAVERASKDVGSANRSLSKAMESSAFKEAQRALVKEGKLRARAAKEAEYVIPAGSRERQILEATRQLYKNDMARIVGEIQTEALIARRQADQQIESLVSGLFPRERLSAEGIKRLEEAKNRIMGAFAEGSEIASIPAAPVSNLIDKLNDPLLASRYEAALSKINRSTSMSIDQKAAAQVALEEKFFAKYAELEQKVRGLQQDLTPLEAALRIKPRSKLLKGTKGKGLTKADVEGLLPKLDTELDEFIKGLDDIDFDLRHPKDVRRSYETASTSSFNRLEAEKFDFDSRLQAFKEAAVAKQLEGMSPSEIARVNRLVNESATFHDLLKGKLESIGSMKAQLVKIAEKIEARKAEGKDVDHLEKTKTKLEKKIEILRDDESATKVLEAARLMKAFFDGWLDDLRKQGILDENFSEDLFFSRVDVAGYIPHMISQTTRSKVNALVGRGVLPVSVTASFGKVRKLKGTIDEINAAKRVELAEEIIRHQAIGGAYGDEGVEAANSMASLRRFLDELHASNPDTVRAWDDLVEDARLEFGLDDMYEFFETNPMVLMERYNSIASARMADAVFINDILDLFPMGRQFQVLYGDKADFEAQRSGYVRLSKVDHLQATLLAKLPNDLRKFEALIKQQLAENVPLKEILDNLEAGGVKVDADIVQSFRSTDVFVPIQVGEYLNWMHSKEALLAKRTFGTEMWDGIHSWMKGQATIAALAHIGRNWIGNVVSASQELGWQAINPVNQVKAMMIWGSWGDKWLDKVIKVGKYEMPVREWRELFKEAGFYDTPLSSEFMKESVGLPGTRELASGQQMLINAGLGSVGVGAGAAIGAMFGLAPAGALAGGALAVMAAKRWNPIQAVKGGSAMERFVGKSVEEMRARPSEAIAGAGNRLSGVGMGALVGSTAGPLGTIAGAAIGGLSMPDYVRMMGQLNQSVEAQARLSMAIGALNKGMDIDSALASVNGALRDYSHLTPLERNVFRRLFFFYTWEAGNVRFQLRWMAKRPRAMRTTFAFLNGLQKGQFSEDEITSLPEQWRYRVLLRTGASKIMGISGLPQEPLFDILSRGKKGQIGRGLATRIHPIPLTVMEYMIGGGHSVYYDKGWEELNNVRQLKNAPPLLKHMAGFPESPTSVPVYKDGINIGTKLDYRAENPELFYLMQRFPGWRVMQQYMILSADTFNSYAMDSGDQEAMATPYERALMFTLGWKMSTIDWEAQKKYMMWRLEQDLLHELELRKKRARVRVNKLNALEGWSAYGEPVNPFVTPGSE